ncbi:MAG: protein kinase [Tannerella sp.]|jgi:serine/threonine-protein kinase|nr:protein kinase [Tannerella sp.]
MKQILNIPNHTIVREIGRGGMGTVYLATDTMLQRQVAVKALKPGTAAQAENMRRFQSEAVTLARLRHPNITMLYNLVRDGSHWCMIMEYVEGETLETMLRSRRTLPVDQALHIGIQTLEGLRHAHGRGVVHRDLKPSNLMLSTEGEVKIMDFGIARIAGHSRLTRVGQAVGTPQYMSPEQVRGQEGNHASDIYSLGVVLYELLTGVPPFASDSEFEILQAHISRKPAPPASLNPAIPAALNSAILRALAKTPSQRFTDADEFMQLLKQIAAPERPAAGDSGGRYLRPAFTLPARWKWPDVLAHWKRPDIIAHLTPLSKIDRQYWAGAGFLLASLIAVCVILFWNGEAAPPPDEPSGELATDGGQSPLIEVEPDTDMNSVMQGQQRSPISPPPAQRQPVAPVTGTGENINRPIAAPKEKEKDNKTSPPKKTVPESKKDEGREPAHEQPPKEQPKETPPKETPAREMPPPAQSETDAGTTSLDRQAVVPRGTRVDVSLDAAYDYDTAPDGAVVSLSVMEPVVLRSGVTIIRPGAKASALLRRQPRRKTLTLEMLEVECVTGRKLKTLNTTYKATAFRQGETFKVNLEYNRVN